MIFISSGLLQKKLIRAGNILLASPWKERVVNTLAADDLEEQRECKYVQKEFLQRLIQFPSSNLVLESFKDKWNQLERE